MKINTTDAARLRAAHQADKRRERRGKPANKNQRGAFGQSVGQWQTSRTVKALSAAASFYEAEHPAGLGHRFVAELRRLADKFKEAAQ